MYNAIWTYWLVYILIFILFKVYIVYICQSCISNASVYIHRRDGEIVYKILLLHTFPSVLSVTIIIAFVFTSTTCQYASLCYFF